MEKKRHMKWDRILMIAGLVCLVVYVVVSYINMMEDRRTQEEFACLRQLRDTGTASVADSSTDTYISPYHHVFEMNQDMVAWLNISGTTIDYPVMQTIGDEEYYLYRNFDGEKDKNGSLLLDTDSDLNQLGSNLIIHGHNMRSGAMFGSLDEYRESSYGKKHNRMYLYTREEEREYELIAVFRSKVFEQEEEAFKYYQYFGGRDDESFEEFYQNIKKMSIYDTEVTAKSGDEFLTLSTCSYHTKNGRFVVVGKRVK